MIILHNYYYVPLINHVSTVITGKSQTEAGPDACIYQAIVRLIIAIHQGWGLWFLCNVQTDAANKLFIIWLF